MPPSTSKTIYFSLLLAFSFSCFASLDHFKMLQEQLQACTSRNDRVIFSKSKNCLALAKKLTQNLDATNIAYIKVANYIRQSFGDTASLSFYGNIVASKADSASCKLPGLKKAILSGLKLPTSFQKEIKLAREIVFEHCWEVHKSEIVKEFETKIDLNENLKSNICIGLKSRNLFNKACL